MSDSAFTLHDQIARVINTTAFAATLEEGGESMIDFQCSWNQQSGGNFYKLPELYQRAILAGEAELTNVGELVFA